MPIVAMALNNRKGHLLTSDGFSLRSARFTPPHPRHRLWTDLESSSQLRLADVSTIIFNEHDETFFCLTNQMTLVIVSSELDELYRESISRTPVMHMLSAEDGIINVHSVRRCLDLRAKRPSGYTVQIERTFVADSGLLGTMFLCEESSRLFGTQGAWVFIWELETGRLMNRFNTQKESRLTCLQWSFLHDFLIASCLNGTISIWSIDNRGQQHVVAELSGHRGPVTFLEYEERGNLLFSSGDDGTVRVWSIDDMGEVSRLQLAGVNSAHSTARERMISDGVTAAASDRGVYLAWPPGRLLFQRGRKFGRPHSEALNRNGALLVASGPWMSLLEVDQTVTSFGTLSAPVLQLCLSFIDHTATNHRQLMVLTRDNTVTLCDTRWGNIVAHRPFQTSAETIAQTMAIARAAEKERTPVQAPRTGPVALRMLRARRKQRTTGAMAQSSSLQGEAIRSVMVCMWNAELERLIVGWSDGSVEMDAVGTALRLEAKRIEIEEARHGSAPSSPVQTPEGGQSRHGRVLLRDVSVGKPITAIVIFQLSVSEARFSRHLRRCSGSGAMARAKAKVSSMQQRSQIQSILEMPDDDEDEPSSLSCLVTGDSSGRIALWCLRCNSVFHQLLGHSDSICHVSCIGAQWLISVSIDAHVRIWETSSTEQVAHSFTGHDFGVACALPLRQSLLLAYDDGMVEVWRMPWHPDSIEDAKSDAIVSAKLKEKREAARSAGFDHVLLTPAKSMAVLPHHIPAPAPLAPALSSTRSGGAIGEANLPLDDNTDWVLEAPPRLMRMWEAHPFGVRVLESNSSQNLILSTSEDQILKIWSYPIILCLRTLQLSATVSSGLFLSTDNDVLLAAGNTLSVIHSPVSESEAEMTMALERKRQEEEGIVDDQLAESAAAMIVMEREWEKQKAKDVLLRRGLSKGPDVWESLGLVLPSAASSQGKSHYIVGQRRSPSPILQSVPAGSPHTERAKEDEEEVHSDVQSSIRSFLERPVVPIEIAKDKLDSDALIARARRRMDKLSIVQPQHPLSPAHPPSPPPPPSPPLPAEEKPMWRPPPIPQESVSQTKHQTKPLPHVPDWLISKGAQPVLSTKSRSPHGGVWDGAIRRPLTKRTLSPPIRSSPSPPPPAPPPSVKDDGGNVSMRLCAALSAIEPARSERKGVHAKKLGVISSAQK